MASYSPAPLVRSVLAMILGMLLGPAALAEAPRTATPPSGLDANGQPSAPLSEALRGAVDIIPETGPVAQPMIVTRMRGKDRCGKLCPEWIVAQGMITAKTPERFRQQLQRMGKARLPIVLDSPGGDLDAALAIGRLIRARGLATLVGSSIVQGCGPRDPACNTGGQAYAGYVVPTGRCAGACLFVLAGGTQRAAYWAKETSLPAPDTLRTRSGGGDADKVIGGYLAEMGISAGLVPRIRRSSLLLNRSDMLRFGLSTGRQRVEDLTGSSICLAPVPAANCTDAALPRPQVARTDASVPRSAARSVKRASPRRLEVIILGGIDEM